MNAFTIKTALVAVVLGLSISVPAVAAGKDCKKLKEKVEQQLKAKGDSGSYVRIYEADDQVEGKEIGLCDNGKYKVVLIEVEPS